MHIHTNKNKQYTKNINTWEENKQEVKGCQVEASCCFLCRKTSVMNHLQHVQSDNVMNSLRIGSLLNNVLIPHRTVTHLVVLLVEAAFLPLWVYLMYTNVVGWWTMCCCLFFSIPPALISIPRLMCCRRDRLLLQQPAGRWFESPSQALKDLLKRKNNMNPLVNPFK